MTQFEVDFMNQVVFELHRIADALDKTDTKLELEERVSSLEKRVSELSAGINCGGYHE